jgi:hypothetical protein
MLDGELRSIVDIAKGAASTERGNARKAPTRSNDRRRMINPRETRPVRN